MTVFKASTYSSICLAFLSFPVDSLIIDSVSESKKHAKSVEKEILKLDVIGFQNLQWLRNVK